MRLLDPTYVAGILDGEGCILTRHDGHRQNHSPNVGVANVNLPLIEGLAKLGGAVQDLTGRPLALGSLPIWEWTVVGERAALVLRACRPWLLVKADKADRVLAAWEASTYLMKNPRKRRTHILEARADMEARGWPVSGPDLSKLPCRHGHPMTPANTYETKEGPVCHPCKNAAHARHERKRKAVAA